MQLRAREHPVAVERPRIVRVAEAKRRGPALLQQFAVGEPGVSTARPALVVDQHCMRRVHDSLSRGP